MNINLICGEGGKLKENRENLIYADFVFSRQLREKSRGWGTRGIEFLGDLKEKVLMK